MESLQHAPGIHPGISLQGVSLVYLYTDWCIPCAMMAPILDSLMKTGVTTMIAIDIEKNLEEAAFFQIYDIPTFILFKNAKTVWQHSGIVSETILRQVIESIGNTANN